MKLMEIYKSSEITVHKLNELREEDKKIQKKSPIRSKCILGKGRKNITSAQCFFAHLV